MISILLITILAISLAAAAGFGMLTLIKTSDLAMTVQRNQIRVDAVAASLAAGVSVSPDGRVRTPVGMVGDDLSNRTFDMPDGRTYTRASGLPVPASAPFRRTSWGLPIVWCPASFAAGGNAPSDGGTQTLGDYVIEVDGSEAPKGVDGTGLLYSLGGHPEFSAPEGDLAEDYVRLTAAAVDRMGAVGFLVSPAPTATAGTRVLCSDIYVSATGEHLIAKEGTVTAVLGLAAASPLRLGQATVVTLLPNAGDGRAVPRVGVVGSLGEAVALAGRYNTSALDVRLRPGRHSVSAEDFARLAALSASKRVSIRGEAADGSPAAAGQVVVQVGGSGAPAGGEMLFEMRGAARVENLTLEGVSRDGFDVGLGAAPSASVETRNASLGFVRARGGKVFLDTGSSVSRKHSLSKDSYPAIGLGGDIVMAGGVRLEAPGAWGGVRISGGDLTLLGKVDIDIAAGGRAFLADQGARVLPAFDAPTVTLNLASVPVDSASTYGAGSFSTTMASLPTFGSGPDTAVVTGRAAERKLLASETASCASGSSNCAAACPAGSVVAWGECGSGNAAALASFGASADGRSWSCSWSQPAAVQSPTAKVVCETLPWAAPSTAR